MRRADSGVTTQDLLWVTSAAIEDGNGAAAIEVYLDRIPSALWMDIFSELCDLRVH
jgi:hypothetical protein